MRCVLIYACIFTGITIGLIIAEAIRTIVVENYDFYDDPFPFALPSLIVGVFTIILWIGYAIG